MTLHIYLYYILCIIYNIYTCTLCIYTEMYAWCNKYTYYYKYVYLSNISISKLLRNLQMYDTYLLIYAFNVYYTNLIFYQK